jgi:4-hydroxybenzoate polyprenyltransferase
MEQDSIAGKHPEASFFSIRQLRLILSLLAIFALGIPLYYGDFRIKALGLITFFLATFYSLRPIRFKERGFVGILVATLSQRPLLFMFFPLLIPSCDITLFWILLGWIFFLGLSVEIAHQLDDFDNDIKAGVITWATKGGKINVKKWLIFTIILILFFICMPAFIFPIPEGLTVTFALLVFSGYSLFYDIVTLKNAYNYGRNR